MREIKKFFICAVVLILGPLSAHAQLIINEVMYDLDGTDTGREWIEIKNIGEQAIDATQWRLFEGNTNHKINKITVSEISAGGFAIIADDPAKFQSDNSSFTGLLFESAFSLSNNGEAIGLRDPNLADVDSITYEPSIGGLGDGNSLQKTAAGWVAAAPTPSALNALFTTAQATSTPEKTENESEPYSAHSKPPAANTKYDPPELEVSAGRTRLGFVGVPLPFEAKVKSTKNITTGNAVSNVWSMGDGTQKWGEFISHAYEFPGEYIVILNSQSGGASAVSKVKIKVVEPKIAITSATNAYVEVANNDSVELNLGGFALETRGRRFNIPTDTLVSPHSSIKLPATVTKLSSLYEFVKIVDPRGVNAAIYPISAVEIIVEMI